MKNHEELEDQYHELKQEVDKTLSNLIVNNAGKRIITQREQEEGEYGEYLSYTNDLSGNDIDFHLIGIDEDCQLIAVDADGDSIDGMKFTQVQLWAKIAIVEILETL